MSFTQHRGIAQRISRRIRDIISHDSDYGYGDNDTESLAASGVRRTVKSFFLDKAINQAKSIQAKHPNRLLCGGLALKLYGVIERTSFSDLDFIALEKSVKDKEYISLKCATPHIHCLFLGSYVEEGETIDGLVLQDLDQIIYHKMLLGRDKDIEDLKAYHERDFFTEEEFIVDI
jgi:hypothetical protein